VNGRRNWRAGDLTVPDPLQLVPGVRRMRPDDHFMVLSETDASPMHIGALLVLEVPEGEKAGFAERFRQQLRERLPATPLLARLVQSPEGYDSDVWADVAEADLAVHIIDEALDLPGNTALLDAVAERNMARLDLARPPFMAHVFTRIPGDRVAVYFKMHHCVADGIGFQEVLRLLSDSAPVQPARTADAVLPGPAQWRELADRRFAMEADLRAAQSAARKAALAALAELGDERAPTPQLRLSGPTSSRRTYATVSVDVERFKSIAKALGGTVNDLLLAAAGSALRRYLIEIADLPDAPLTINSARSYRRDEHGKFGNRIVALHPHIATHLADPRERFAAVRASMAGEMRRTRFDEALLDAAEKPFGARDRRAAFADRMAGGKRLLPGNISLSNVPGPADRRSYASYPVISNFPVPIIGSSRFLNITSRRSGTNLDMGVIADPAKIPDVGKVASYFEQAIQEYQDLVQP
jgi:WS/DGAT/MGAT family acyltransferase